MSPQPGKVSNVRVLVVEDNIVNQKVAMKMLEKLGSHADVAANGLEAVTMGGQFSYDLVFMDCQMPEMDGYEATAEIRRREGTSRHTPIIAMTAHAMQGDLGKMPGGGDGRLYLKANQERSHFRDDSKIRHPQGGIMNFRGLAKQLEIEEGDMLEIIGLFLETSASDLRQLESAIDEEDAKSAVCAAHSIKGAAANPG